jgi:hypothetical protein
MEGFDRLVDAILDAVRLMALLLGGVGGLVDNALDPGPGSMSATGGRAIGGKEARGNSAITSCGGAGKMMAAA